MEEHDPDSIAPDRAIQKRRTPYAISAGAIVALGLRWRSQLLPVSPFMRKYGGDALWALLIFLLIRVIRPSRSVVSSAIAAFGIATAVEVSQLWHAPWIEAIRDVRLGSLILGSHFNWPDIPAYAAGILVGAWLDRAAVARR